MKKRILKDLETKIREQIAYFYMKAYAVLGEKTGAEKLTEEAVFYGAKRYGDLINKNRFYDIVEQKIGDGDHTDFEPCDPSILSDRIISRIQAWNHRSTITKAVGMVAIIGLVIVGAYILIFPRTYEAKSDEVPIMKHSIALEGDYDISEFVNYQRISDRIEISQEMLNLMETSSYADHLASIVTTPDGTPYLMINHMTETKEKTLPFTLYRGDENGWHTVGTGNIGAGDMKDIEGKSLGWVPSKFYVFADKDSNVYAVIRLAEDILIYQYHKAKDTFGVVATIPFHNDYDDGSFVIDFDLDCGEKGTAYIACRKEPIAYDGEDNGTLAEIFRYDTATGEVSRLTDDLRLISEHSKMNIYAKNDLVYLTDSYSNTDRTNLMLLNIVYPDGYADFDYFETDLCSPIVAMEMDKNEKLHIVTDSNGKCYHYIFSNDLSFTKGELAMSYHPYRDTKYYREMIGAFLGRNGRVYCLEFYHDGAMGERSFVAIGMLDSEEASSYIYVNGFDLIDNMGWMHYQNEKDIWHITSEYRNNEAYLVYFHISELD